MKRSRIVAKLPGISVLLLATLAAASAAHTAPPDVIYFHGNILTGSHLRPSDTSPTPARVSAIAVSKGRILAVGSDPDLLKLQGPSTQLVDLKGAFAMPGFNDAHTHIAEAGRQKLTVDLDGVTSLAEMQQRIKTYVSHSKQGAWIQGGGWDHTKWASKTLPTRQDIDAVTAGHPAVFSRTDGHIVVANSAALAAASITASTPDPAGAKIDRDPSGSLTGIVRENPAVSLIYKVIPQPSLEERRSALKIAIEDALSHGVTSVQDYSSWEDFLALEELEHAGKLHLRVSEWLDFTTPLTILKQRRASHPADDPLLHIVMLKGFMDGSLGSRTAAMEQPYTDDPANSGIPRYQQDKLNQMATERAAAGFQLGFHAIGDRANAMALNALAAAEQVAIPADHPPAPRHPDAEVVTSTSPSITPASLRFRIEHAQVLLPQDFDRFASLGVIACMQPSHLLTDMHWAGARLGPDREPYAYAWKSFLDHHVTLAFGTDYPVESISPFRGLYAAVTRQDETGAMTFHPEQKISLAEALFAYTQASAFAEFREHDKGRLEPGFFADFIVLNRDITTSNPREILQISVERTVVNGETVYLSSPPTH